MKRAEGIAYLTDHGRNNHLACFSKYGATTRDCAPVAWRLAFILARETCTDIDSDLLDYCMGLVVNEHSDVAYMIREYGHGMYR